MTAPRTLVNLALRRATPADAASIIDIHVRSRAVTYRGLLRDSYLDAGMRLESDVHWPAKLRAIEAGAGHALLCELDGVPVGFICLIGPDATGDVLVENLHALPERKGAGVGTALLAAARQWALDGGARRLHLLVLEDNLMAIRFYESRGWRLAGRKDDTMGGVDIVALRYELALA